MGINLKTYYYRLSIICYLLSFTLALQAQTTRQLKVYLKGGVVDEVKVDANASLRHSRVVNNQEQSDYVTIVVTDAEGYEHPYLISRVDSLVLPSGQRVVFMGCMQSQPRRSSFSGNFPGEGVGNVTFYWTENDHIRLDAGYESRALNLTNDKTNASFVFEDLDTEVTSYTVYFPDKVVTIPTVQTQSGADNTDHIGRSGDCGTAEATLTSTPQSLTPNYSFTLLHKAAYLCFLPIIDHLPSVKVTKIQLSCNEAIAGNYELSLSGLYNPTNTSKKITLNLNAQRPRDFLLGHQIETEQDMCAAYMVIAPQTAKKSFTATYFLTDTLSRTTTHNNAVFAHFHTDGSIVFSGYDCLVTLKPDEVEQFNIPHNTVVDLTEEHMTWLLNTKGLTTMKVYDSGGPNGNYDNSANGSLIFRLPQGYRMHVYGTSNTENSDHMKVYDTDGVKVDVAGQNKTIDYTTTSNYLRLQLITDGSVIYSGVDLTVDFIRDGSSLFLHVPR